MPATRPVRRELVGRFIRLIPLQQSDLAELFDALRSPDVYAGGWGGGPAGFRATEAEFVEFGRGYFAWDSGNVYGARLIGGAHDGALVGTSTLGDFDETNEHAHIGWTAWDPRVWGTAVNPEAKLLMLAEAFDSGFGRVKLQADELNDRSRAAIEKLGGRFEGIIRRERLRADGSWRDTAVYSILADEWPAVRADLEARLAQFGGHAVARRETPEASD
jgi:RimJ/RimL family protein N-acetyltransferase